MGWWLFGSAVGALVLFFSMGWVLWVYRWRVMLGAAQREADSGDLETAERHLQEALNEAVRRYGEGGVRVGQIWRFAIDLYRRKGQIEQARQAAKQALWIAEARYGEQSLESAELHSLSAALAFEGHAFREAEALALRAMAIQSSSPSASAMEGARTKVLLGRISLRLDQPQRAVVYFEEALRVMEVPLLVGRGDRGNVVYFEEALRVMEAHAEHSESKQAHTIRLEIADLLALQDQDETALQMLEPLLLLPDSSEPTVLRDRAEAFSLQSALLSRQTNKKQEARVALEQALRLWRESTAHLTQGQHTVESGFARDLSRLGAWFQAEGKQAEAIPLYEEAIARLRKDLLEADKEAIGGWLAALGDAYRHTDQAEKAEAAYIEALEWQQAIKGDTHPDVSVLRNNLASIYHAQGRLDQAGALYRLALRSLDAAHPQHPSIPAILNNLGGICTTNGQYGEAEQAYQRALSVAEKVFGRDHLDVAGILENHAALLHQTGDFDRAERWTQRAKKIRRNNAAKHREGI
ncbi:tetratricopeptide repeat protein [Myxococcota bacterium]|nr:tetratricopeptide repeat protein [Myxococcota bacterium]